MPVEPQWYCPRRPESLSGGLHPHPGCDNPYGEQKLVSIAANASEFVEAIDRILKRSREEIARWLARVEAELSHNSWDYTWKKTMTLIESSMAAKEEEELKDEKASKHPEATIPSIGRGPGAEKNDRER